MRRRRTCRCRQDDGAAMDAAMALLCSTVSVTWKLGRRRALAMLPPSRRCAAWVAKISVALAASANRRTPARRQLAGIDQRRQIEQQLLRALDGEGGDQQVAAALERQLHFLAQNSRVRRR